jgi:hypothetical protein
MKIAQLILTEYRRDITDKSIGTSLRNALSMDQSQIGLYINGLFQTGDTDDAYERIENADPTSHKEYVQWIIRVYSKQNGTYKMEDVLSTLSDAIYKFDLMKKHKQITGPEADINRYPTPESLLTFVEKTYKEPKSIDKGDANEVVNNQYVRIIIPKNEAAAKYYGQGTRWCTAAHNDNQFDNYNSRGNLFIIIPKKPTHTGEKYQYFDGDNGYIANEADKKLSEKQREDIQTRLKLYEYFSTIGGGSENDLISLSPKEIKEKKTKIKSFLNKNGHKIENTNVSVIIPENISQEFIKYFRYFDDENNIDYTDTKTRRWIFIDRDILENCSLKVTIANVGVYLVHAQLTNISIMDDSTIENIEKIISSKSKRAVLKSVTATKVEEIDNFKNYSHSQIQHALNVSATNKLGPALTDAPKALRLWSDYITKKLKEL